MQLDFGFIFLIESGYNSDFFFINEYIFKFLIKKAKNQNRKLFDVISLDQAETEGGEIYIKIKYRGRGINFPTSTRRRSLYCTMFLDSVHKDGRNIVQIKASEDSEPCRNRK